ncbi:hypothetical protein BGX27_009426 [Mortierella sp. AM989]|nr:hypothetical protein BGX27_009426 [Mortierella sp. AM989]
MIRIPAVRHAPNPHSSGIARIASVASSRPAVLIRQRRRPGTHATVFKATTRGYVTSSSKAAFSTSASLKKKRVNSAKVSSTIPEAGTTRVEGDVIYRKEGSKIIPAMSADHIEAPISTLFSQFGNLSKPSHQEDTIPLKKDASNLDPSMLTLKDVLPTDEYVQQFITQHEIKITLDELKHEVQRLLDVLPLPEDDPKRIQTEKEFWKNGGPLALAMFKLAVDNGDFFSKYSYGVILYRGIRGVPANPSKGRAIIESLAKPAASSRVQGLPVAMSTLAGIYARDDKNYEAARDMYLAAANKGIVEARVSLGRMYLSGELPEDPVAARKCFEQAIKQDDGNAEAHFMLGALDMASLKKASGEEEDNEGKKRSKLKSSFQHYQKAASKGLPEAQYNVGLAYFRGQGVPKNDALAIEYWKMSGQQGFGLAQLSLGTYYFQNEQPQQGEEGSTVTKHDWDPSKRDLMQAQKWFTLASRRQGMLGQEGQRLKMQVDEAIKKGGGRSKNGRFCTIM